MTGFLALYAFSGIVFAKHAYSAERAKLQEAIIVGIVWLPWITWEAFRRG